METSTEPQAVTAEGSTQTRERLLDAAEVLFAERGFRAASVREITQRAECNLAAVNYHFGGKANLYREVFLRRLVALRLRRLQAVERAMSEAGDTATLETLLDAFTVGFLEPLVDGSTGRRWIEMVSREMLDPQLPADLFYNEMVVPTHRALRAALHRLFPHMRERTADLCIDSVTAQLFNVVQLYRCFGNANSEAIRHEFLPSALAAHAVRFCAAAIHGLAAQEHAQ